MKKFAVLIFVVFLFSEAFCSGIVGKINNDTAVIVMGSDGKIIVDKNSGRELTPASTLKILTSLAALELLGEKYRFKTEFYLGENNNLYIKGYGDPLLISEVIKSVSDKITERIGKRVINDIVTDASFFRKKLSVPGVEDDSTQPYDAVNGALCSNFNTVFFKRDPKGGFESAEKQTPLLNFVLKRIKKKNYKSGRIKLSSAESMLYTGYLFKYFLENKGIRVKGEVRDLSERDMDKKELFYTYRSDYTLSDIIKKLMEFSNNFTANQIFLTIGAEKSGPPADLSKGRIVVQKFVEDKGYRVKVIEGSGISRKNRISAFELMKILNDFKKYYTLLKKDKNDFFKTGTMKNVSSRAGFLKIKKKLYSYVIIVNGNDAYKRLSKIHRSIKKELNSLI